MARARRIGLEVLRRKLAKRDIVEIAKEIADHNEAAGRGFVLAVEERIATLARVPGLDRECHFRARVLRGLRRCGVPGYRNHLIFYRPSATRIEIVRVVHGARNLPRVLRDSPPEGAGGG